MDTVDIGPFAYTTGGELALEHRRKIGSGGFGDVHEVCLCPKLLILCVDVPRLYWRGLNCLINTHLKGFRKEIISSSRYRGGNRERGPRHYKAL